MEARELTGAEAAPARAVTATPDLGLPLTLACAAKAYVCAGDPEAFVLLPDGLALARAPASEGGRPMFTLEHVHRGPGHGLPDHGMLAFRLAARYAAATEALAVARQFAPAASLRFACFTHGFLRLSPMGAPEHAAPEALCAPRALCQSGLGFWYRAALDGEAALYLAEALQSDGFALRAYAELLYTARTVRVPVRVAFDPAALARPLGFDEHSHTCTRASLTELLRYALARGELIARVGECANALLAEVLADWVIARFGALVPAPQPDGQMHVRLDLPEGGRPARWDLDAPMLASRVETLEVAPLVTAEALGPGFAPDDVHVGTRASGVVSLRPRVLVPPGLREPIGVDVHAPTDPARPIASIAFEPPTYRPSPEAPLALPLPRSPREPRRCMLTPFVVLDGAKYTGIGHELALRTESSDDAAALLDVADVPVRWATVEASPELLQLADVQVTLAAACDPDHRVPAPFTLTAAAAVRTVILPPEVQDVEVFVRARALASGREVAAGPFALSGPCWIDLHSFPAFGHHEVALSWEFSGDEHVATLELAVGEGDDERHRIVELDRLRPTTRVRWDAASPFTRGLRVRRSRAAKWQEVEPSCTHLVLCRAMFSQGRAQAR